MRLVINDLIDCSCREKSCKTWSYLRVERLFPREDEYVLPEYRAQRKLNESRIPIISHYITENRDSYVFSALAASIDGEFKYISSKEISDIGLLEVSMDARFLINDFSKLLL